MQASYWVSFGLTLALLGLHVIVPPASTLLRLPALPSNWIVGGVGIGIGAARFWTLMVPVYWLCMDGRSAPWPGGWTGVALFAALGIVNFAVYASWIDNITGAPKRRRWARLLAPIWAAVVVAQTVGVYLLLYR
jgi:hypothetical protein